MTTPTAIAIKIRGRGIFLEISLKNSFMFLPSFLFFLTIIIAIMNTEIIPITKSGRAICSGIGGNKYFISITSL